ncbi:hypothetical protein [Pseudoxanthomonas wuyuanensis]
MSAAGPGFKEDSTVRNRHCLSAAVFVLGLLVSATSTAEKSKRATAKADAWLGRDASELLMQLRVDGDRVRIAEIEETGETSYTWSTWNSAYTEKVVTGVDRQMIGMTPGGQGVAAAPVFSETVYTEDVYHPPTHRCDITFYADMEGIIRRWEYAGSACRTDVVKPKK